MIGLLCPVPAPQTLFKVEMLSFPDRWIVDRAEGLILVCSLMLALLTEFYCLMSMRQFLFAAFVQRRWCIGGN